MDLGLAGRSYLVTGGSKGLGEAVVRLLLDEGASVTTCARNGEELVALRADLDEVGGRLHTVEADVRDAAAMISVVDEAVATFGQLDGLVVNAGTGATGDVLGTEDDIWDEQLGLKVHSVLNTVRPAVQHLAETAGRIVVINSVTARAPDPTLAAVSAARAAVANLCQSLAGALAPQRIGVVAVNLGALITDRQRQRYQEGHFDVPFEVWCQWEAERRGILLGRLGETEEVAPSVVFLVSPRAAYATATALDVAGGMVRGW